MSKSENLTVLNSYNGKEQIISKSHTLKLPNPEETEQQTQKSIILHLHIAVSVDLLTSYIPTTSVPHRDWQLGK